MEPQSEPANPVWSFPFVPQDWEHTPQQYKPMCTRYKTGVATAVLYGHRPTHGRRVAGLVCAALQLVRRLLREIDSLWVFLAQYGVEPTNNRAERALRFGVLWRKRLLGTASDKGNRWVEQILSLKETCRLQARSTYTVLVEAVTRFFHGQQPDLCWLNEGEQRFSRPASGPG